MTTIRRKETTIVTEITNERRRKSNLSYADYERINNHIMHVQRGEIYIADMGDGFESEQGGVRPVLIIQNDMGNKFSPTTTIIPLTSSSSKANIPTHCTIKAGTGNLRKDSIALVEQTKTIDKKRIVSYVGKLSDEIMSVINAKLALQFGLK